MKFKHFLIGTMFFISILTVGCNSENTEIHQSNVKTGEELFIDSCISCHSTDNLEGGSYKLRAENLERFFNDKDHLFNSRYTYD